jgi:hypothetical protein
LDRKRWFILSKKDANERKQALVYQKEKYFNNGCKKILFNGLLHKVIYIYILKKVIKACTFASPKLLHEFETLGRNPFLLHLPNSRK